ncbi:MAG TPA: hypothetical protein VNV88_10000 [Candidatus Solibacter sp.]|jgi:hypothetical protein|nr:hypothetical protein [Candidatus Solibacter sp.]
MNLNQDLTFAPSSRHRTVALVLIAVGVVVAAYGIVADPKRAWPSLLLNGFYFASLALSGLFFISTQRLTGARWSASLRRIPEAFMAALPYGAILLLVLYFGRHWVFPWSDPSIFAHEPLVNGKVIAGHVAYLQVPFVFSRLVVCVLLWVVFGWLFRRWSLEQDRSPGKNMAIHNRLNRLTPVFVIVFALSFTVVSYDLIISLEPKWSSTMSGVYTFAGLFVSGIAAVTLATLFLREHSPLRDWISDRQIHDLGKLLFAFSTFWAYIWTCQYLLIWYGNIPDEVTHFVKRTHSPWLYFFGLNVVVNWVVPFLALISVKAKCTPKVLKAICVLVLCGHWLDLYMLIMPAQWDSPKILLELPIAAGYAGLLYFIFTRSLAQAPLVAMNDPILLAEMQVEHAH